jgi:hypothetical protein
LNLDHQRPAPGSITFVKNLFVLVGRSRTDGALNRTFDVVLRHVGCLGPVDCQTKTGVRIRIGQALAGGDRDFSCQLGEKLAAFRVRRALSGGFLFAVRATPTPKRIVSRPRVVWKW